MSTPNGPGSPDQPARTLTSELAAAEQLVRELTFSTFVFEIRLGHHLGYLTTFASPRIAQLLTQTGQIDAEPRRRGTDTGLFVYELIHHGMDSATGRRIVDRINTLHAPFRFRDEDNRWVLATFVLPGIRVAERFGWRPLTDTEADALLAWYGELGVRLGVQDLPADLAGLRAQTAAYERDTLAPSRDGQRLLAATRDVVVGVLPRPLRPLAVAAAGVLIEDPVRGALGLHPPGPVLTGLTTAVLRLRAVYRRVRGPRSTSWFTPGGTHTVYPDGYTIEDLGPRVQTTT